jgi:hypothetical protein
MGKPFDWVALRTLLRELNRSDQRRAVMELRSLADELERDQKGLDLAVLLPEHLIVALRDDLVVMQSWERDCPVGRPATVTIITQDRQNQRYRTSVLQGHSAYDAIANAVNEQDRRWEAARKAKATT